MSSATEATRKIIDGQMSEIGATSIILYVRDPWWDEEFRLVHMPGVQITEPMHGFFFNEKSIRLEGGPEEYLSDVTADQTRDPLTPELSKLTENNKIFGDFIHRENVVSRARFKLSRKNRLIAVLFVNFNVTTTFNEDQKAKLRELVQLIAPHISNIIDEIAAKRFPGAQLVRILSPTQQLASFDSPDPVALLKTCFGEILDAAFDALRIGYGDGLGTIHLYDTEAKTLHLEVYRGPINDDGRELSVVEGEGIISWVALKKRAIIIDNIDTSEFKTIYVNMLPGMKSEIAVPMIAGDLLLGVINLECDTRSRYSTDDLRTVSYAANQAAIACRLHRQLIEHRRLAERTELLLQVCHQAVTAGESGEHELASLDKLAEIACEVLRAERCDIWLFDQDCMRFTNSGASYKSYGATSPPRPDGLSFYVIDQKRPVWIDEIRNRSQYDMLTWDLARRCWERVPAEVSATMTLNELVIENAVACELGIPIQVHDRMIGVAWLKFTPAHAYPPTIKTMMMAAGFASEAGLVMDSTIHHQSLRRMKVEEAIRNETKQAYFPTRLDKLPGLEFSIIDRPASASLGGDFHSVLQIDDEASGFLIGDGEGHGINGMLYMLPLIAVFRSFDLDSRSTKRVFKQLYRVAHDLQIRGTALYFLVAKIGEELTLIGSSAGHPSILIFSATTGNVHSFPKDNDAIAQPFGIEREVHIRDDSHRLTSGDLIIAFTDGVSEAGMKQRSDGQVFGVDGIKRAVEPLKNQPCKIIGDAIKRSASEFAGPQAEDDLTIIVLRVS